MTHLLAVYGTLKGGFHNHDILGDSQYVGSGWVRNFALVDEGRYPAAFRFPRRKVWVEVYQVTDKVLIKTDILEGVDSGYYKRDRVQTDEYGEVFMYTQAGRVMEANSDRWFPDGIWSGPFTETTLWLGWKSEIRILDKALSAGDKDKEAVEAEDAASVIDNYDPPEKVTSRSSIWQKGKTIKAHNKETGEIVYVPVSECLYEVGKNKYIPLNSKLRVIEDDDDKSLPFVPNKSVIVKEPEKKRELTNHEIAREIIARGVKDFPNIPEEKMA